MKYIFLYNLDFIQSSVDIFDIIIYLTDCGYIELAPKSKYFINEEQPLFLIDYENNTSKIIIGQHDCVSFLSEQSLIINLKDKACSYRRYLYEKKTQ